MYECVIVGGGPAGLSAALVLGRAGRNILVVDDNSPRNAVTKESHSYLTQDGISPQEFRKRAKKDLLKYTSIQFSQNKVIQIAKEGDHFLICLKSGEEIVSKKVLLTLGLREEFPAIEGIAEFYGKTLFNCPYCDGYELRNKKLVVISDNEMAFHFVKTVYNWSKDIILATNGTHSLTEEQKATLAKKVIQVKEEKILLLEGKQGQLEGVVLESGEKIACQAGFITPYFRPNIDKISLPSITVNDLGGVKTNENGESSVEGLYSAGDSAYVMPSQLIFAAADGSRVGMAINMELSMEDFEENIKH